MFSKYLIKIYTEQLQTEFTLETESSMITMQQVHNEIIDYLGKNDIKWKPNKLRYNGRSKFYITYEEVDNGTGQNVAIRPETETRVKVERAVS
jgi:hypothetical protein